MTPQRYTEVSTPRNFPYRLFSLTRLGPAAERRPTLTDWKKARLSWRKGSSGEKILAAHLVGTGDAWGMERDHLNTQGIEYRCTLAAYLLGTLDPLLDQIPTAIWASLLPLGGTSGAVTYRPYANPRTCTDAISSEVLSSTPQQLIIEITSPSASRPPRRL